MSPIREGRIATKRHESAYLASGPETGPLIVFVHGWPELSLSWRHQLPVFGALGLHAVAPDMRGYGRSSVYSTHADYALEQSVQDMIELIDALGAQRAIFVGHDWGAPTVWSLAQHHPERCLAVANLCVPYIPNGFAPANIIPLADRRLYPEAEFPAAQWDYQLFYEENFEAATRTFQANVTNTVRGLFRRGSPDDLGQPVLTARVRAMGGWFGPLGAVPPFPRDEAVIGEADEAAYVEALERNGFFGPDSWYMNAKANIAFADAAKAKTLRMPVLFLHAAYDGVCATVDTRLAEPMRAHCPDLSETIVPSGHWMAQEKPQAVNAALALWLARRVPDVLEPQGG